MGRGYPIRVVAKCPVHGSLIYDFTECIGEFMCDCVLECPECRIILYSRQWIKINKILHELNISREDIVELPDLTRNVKPFTGDYKIVKHGDISELIIRLDENFYYIIKYKKHST